MWHYMSGTPLDFTGAPDDCRFVLKHRVTADTRFVSMAELLDASNSWAIIAGREWITDDGWIDWDGKGCPLDRGDVDVRWRSGRFIRRRGVHSIAGNWTHDGSRRDIVAYRPWPEPTFDMADDTPIPF